MKRLATLTVLCLFLSGCAMPVSFRVASLAADGISYLTTKKSVTDHGLSMVSGQDCAVMRLVSEGSVCRKSPPGIDFNTNLAPQIKIEALANTALCDIPKISRDLPNKGEINLCAKRLVDEFGGYGALKHTDLRIDRHIDDWESEYAGIWIAVQLAVRQSIDDTSARMAAR